MKSPLMMLSLAILLAGVVPARADDNEKAREHLGRGFALVGEGRLEEAAAEYRRVTALAGAHPTYRDEAEARLRGFWQSSLDRARELLREENRSGALEQLAAARELAPDDYALARTALLEAESHYQAGDRARALGLYRAVVESEAALPTDLSMEALLALGDAENRAGNHARAREIYLEARALRGPFLAAHRERLKFTGFDIIMETSRYHDFLPVRDRFTSRWEESFFRVAETWRVEENTAAALENLLELAENDGADVNSRTMAWRDAAALYQEAGMRREAVEALERATRFRCTRALYNEVRRRLQEARELLGE